MKQLEELEEIAKELKEFIGEEVFLEGTVGKRIFNVFMAPLYEIKNNERSNVIIEFNEYFKKHFGGEETKAYKKAKEFSNKNDYLLHLKKYDMTPPKPKLGVLF